MKIVIQRSRASRVEVNSKVVGAIEKGLVLLVCLEKGDTQETVEKASSKILALRTFDDPETGKMGLNIQSAQGEFLCISQFTLSWEGQKGNRPGWERSMPPPEANELFEKFCHYLAKVCPVKTGSFGEHMEVFIQNDGPVTYSLSF